jgi:hypothetical protein
MKDSHWSVTFINHTACAPFLKTQMLAAEEFKLSACLGGLDGYGGHGGYGGPTFCLTQYFFD